MRDVELPAGQWFDWWDSSAAPIDGDATLTDVPVPEWERIPLYVKAGAIVPMTVRNDATGIGSASWADKLTVLYYPGPASSFTVHNQGEARTVITAGPGSSGSSLRFTGMESAVVVRAWSQDSPTSVTIGGMAAPEIGTREGFDTATEATWYSDEAENFVYVLVPEGADVTVIIN